MTWRINSLLDEYLHIHTDDDNSSSCNNEQNQLEMLLQNSSSDCFWLIYPEWHWHRFGPFDVQKLISSSNCKTLHTKESRSASFARSKSITKLFHSLMRRCVFFLLRFHLTILFALLAELLCIKIHITNE